MSDLTTEAGVVATPESRAAAETEVLIPETGATRFKFLNHEVRLRALPVYYAKQIHKKLEPFRQQMAQTSDKGMTQEQIGNLDEVTLNALVDAVDVMREYYQLATNRDVIEKNASIPEMLEFVNKQLEVSGKSDFMLASLRLIIKISGLYGSAVDAIDENELQNLSSTSPSATPGASPSMSSSVDTPPAN